MSAPAQLPGRNNRTLAPIAGRVPPHDLGAEAALVSSALLKPALIPELAATVAPEDFYSPAHQIIWQAIVAVHADNRPVDLVTVASWLRDRERLTQAGGPAYLADVVDSTPAVAHAEEHARMIVRKAQRRRAIAEAHAILAEGYGDVEDEAAWLEQLGGRMEASVGISETQCIEQMGDVLRDVFTQIVRASESPVGERETFGARFSLEALNEHFGPLTEGKVTYVAGYPGDGKTSLALQAAVATSAQQFDGKLTSSSLIISAEMPSADLALRGLFQYARVDAGKSRINHIKWISQNEWRDLAAAASDLAQLPIWFDASASTNTGRIRASIRKAKGKSARLGVKLRLVVVDYLQLIHGSNLRKNAQREEEISTIAKDLKDISKSEAVHVLALAQLNDEGRKEKRRPQARDMRESKAVEAHADSILLIYNEAARERSKTIIQKGHAPSKAPEDVELIIDKGRGIEKGTVNAVFWPHLVRFEDAPDWVSEER